jgi:hypothetical protein
MTPDELDEARIAEATRRWHEGTGCEVNGAPGCPVERVCALLDRLAASTERERVLKKIIENLSGSPFDLTALTSTKEPS